MWITFRMGAELTFCDLMIFTSIGSDFFVFLEVFSIFREFSALGWRRLDEVRRFFALFFLLIVAVC